MVDLDNDKEVEPPPDAKYLAQKNNRADQETRAKDTNLQKAQKGEAAASDKSDRDDPEPGADKQKIAELEDKKSALGRRAPDVTPHDNPEVAQKDERRRAQVAARAARSRQAAARADARDRRIRRCPAPPTARSRSRARRARRQQRSVAPEERRAREAGAVRPGLRIPVRGRGRGRAAAGADAEVDPTGEVRSATPRACAPRWRTSSPRSSRATRPR